MSLPVENILFTLHSSGWGSAASTTVRSSMWVLEWTIGFWKQWRCVITQQRNRRTMQSTSWPRRAWPLNKDSIDPNSFRASSFQERILTFCTLGTGNEKQYRRLWNLTSGRRSLFMNGVTFSYPEVRSPVFMKLMETLIINTLPPPPVPLPSIRSSSSEGRFHLRQRAAQHLPLRERCTSSKRNRFIKQAPKRKKLCREKFFNERNKTLTVVKTKKCRIPLYFFSGKVSTDWTGKNCKA